MRKEQDFGDFEEIKTDKEKEDSQQNNSDQPVARARTPRGNEKIGIIIQRLGGNRMEVSCTDGKTRNCRVPGRYKRDLWLRPKDVILVQPWEFDDSKGDIIYKYNPGSVAQLKKQGILNSLKNDF